MQGGRWLLSNGSHAQIYAPNGDLELTYSGRTTPDGAWTVHQVQTGSSGCTGDPAVESRSTRLDPAPISGVREAVMPNGTQLQWSELGSAFSLLLPLPDGCSDRDHAWWTPDGARMACANEWGLGVYTPDGTQLAQWVNEQRAFTPAGASWSGDGTALLLFDERGRVRLWDGADVRWKHTLRTPGPALLTDDGSLAVATQDGRFVFLDAADGTVLGDPDRPIGPDATRQLDPPPHRRSRKPVEEPVRECPQRGSGSVRLAATGPVQLAVSEGGCFAGVAAGGALWLVDLSRQRATLLGEHLDGGTQLDFVGDTLRFSPRSESGFGRSTPKASATWSPRLGFRSTLSLWDHPRRPAGVDGYARPWIETRRRALRVAADGRLTPITKPRPAPTHERTLEEVGRNVFVSDEDGLICVAPGRHRAVLSDSGRYLATLRERGSGIEVIDVDQCRVVREPVPPLPSARDHQRDQTVGPEGTVLRGYEFTWDGTRLRWSRA